MLGGRAGRSAAGARGLPGHGGLLQPWGLAGGALSATDNQAASMRRESTVISTVLVTIGLGTQMPRVCRAPLTSRPPCGP